uniref:Oxidoreductase-like domain-containing protein n=1 Tax=Psilocybe cubensis TaxID=181762 RepID=A0A8H7XP94_PSICU
MLLACRTRYLTINICSRSITTPSNYNHGAISDGTKAATHRRKPARGGQNLSDRYIRLEKSLRGKDTISREIDGLVHPDPESPRSRRSQDPVRLFHGYVVPEEPKPPADDECCMSGCAVCVYDLYEESLEAYHGAIAQLRDNLTAKNIPESDWPLHIRNKKLDIRVEKRKDTILSAFEEMERNLQLKKQQADPGAVLPS